MSNLVNLEFNEKFKGGFNFFETGPVASSSAPPTPVASAPPTPVASAPPTPVASAPPTPVASSAPAPPMPYGIASASWYVEPTMAPTKAPEDVITKNYSFLGPQFFLMGKTFYKDFKHYLNIRDEEFTILDEALMDKQISKQAALELLEEVERGGRDYLKHNNQLMEFLKEKNKETLEMLNVIRKILYN